MKEYIFLIIWIAGVTADSYDFGRCRDLQDPVASHPRHGFDVKAGRLSVYEEGGDIVARAHCDNERGFILINDRFAEMRCSYNEKTGEWSWNHHHRDRRSPPVIRCARVYPLPRVQRFRLGPNFSGCSDPYSKEDVLSSVEERLTTSLPCVLADECIVSDLSCDATETGTVLSVKVTSKAIRQVMEQRLILETAADYLKSYPLHLMLNSPSAHRRVKRFDPSDFDNVETEDVVDTGCPVGSIANTDETCTECTAGTYANTAASPQVCTACDLDTYSGDNAAKCTNCGTGLGTLEYSSGNVADCIAVCTVPTMEFVVRTSPESRAAEGGNVEITCENGYTYGNSGIKTVVCSSSTNNFPASCRQVTVSAPQSSIKSGDSGVVSCVVKANDVGTAIQWFKGDSATALDGDSSDYTISTTLGTNFESDGKTKQSTSDLSILNFDSADVASYSCRVDYTDPILDDSSGEQALAILELSSLESYYYSPTNIQVTYEGSSEPDITWYIDGQVYSPQNNDQLTPSISSPWSGSTIIFSLAFNMEKFPATLAPFTIRATVSFGEASETPFNTETSTIYKREFTQYLPSSSMLRDGDFGTEFLCSASGEDKDLLTLSWKIGQTLIDNKFDHASVTDESDSSSTTTKTSKLTIPANNPALNNVLKCLATWGGANGKTIETSSDVNAIGASMEGSTYSDGVMSCLVWGDAPPHSVTWSDGNGNTISNVTDATIIMQSTNGAIHTHTLTIKQMDVGDEGQYTCSVVFVENEQPQTLVTTLNKLYVRISLCVNWFRFTCEYKGVDDPTKVEWFQDSSDGSSNMLINSDEKYTIRTGDFDTKSKSKTSVISVNSMEVTDSGDYTCKWATNSFNPEATMAVAIRSLTTHSTTINSMDGTIVVTCNFEGTTSGTMEWYHRGQKLVDVADDDITITEGELENHKQQYTLTISNVNPEIHAGSYRCVLVFCDGDNLEAKTEVVARKAILIDTTGSLESYIVVTGDRLTARCCSQGDEVPSGIKWYKGDSEIEMDNVLKMHNTNTKLLDNSVKYFSNLTIKNFAFSDEGIYTCAFTFDDGHNTKSSVNVKFARITNDECVFVDYRTETSKTLTCTYLGAAAATAVSFTLPDDSNVAGELSDFAAGSDAHTPGTQTGSYAIASVSDGNSGLYRCTFTINGGTTVSAIQRLTARKAVIETSEGSLTPNLLVQSSITLTCTVSSGAKSLEWFKDDKAMVLGQDYRMVKSPLSADLISKIEFTIENDSAGSYKCVVRQFDEFCPDGKELESESVDLTVISAAPLRASSARNVAYGGESHTFVCVFPNPFGETEYDIVWSYKGKDDSIAMRMIADGDVTNQNGRRIIDGKIDSAKTVENEISTTLTIDKVNSNTEGEYICMIKWGQIFIKSSPSSLTVRTISSPPVTTNVVKGGAGQLTCEASGDSVASISFHRDLNDESLGAVESINTESKGVVTTTAVLSVGSDVTAAEDSIEYYCKATWEGNEVKSENVYLSILDITGSTETMWGVAGKVAEFNCESHGVLRANGVPYRDEGTGDMVITEAQVDWEFFDTASSTWKDFKTKTRFSKKKSLVGADGIRVSPLLLRQLKESDDGLKVRCVIDYQADTKYNFFGGIVMSGDLTLRLASITSFTSSKTDPIVGDTITLTCTATGETPPSFSFATDGRGNFDTSLYQLVEDTLISSTGTRHSATYTTRTVGTNVKRNGQKIKCEVDYGGVLGTAVKATMVTTYHKCSSLPLRTLNDVEAAVIAEEDHGDGTITRTITCPENTTIARYKLEETSKSGASITCSKEVGQFVKPYLAKCDETKILETGEGGQIMENLPYNLGPCHESITSGEYGQEKMIEKLNSDTDTNCGLRHVVECLRQGSCVLDKTKTSCRWEANPDNKSGNIHFKFAVKLTPPVWFHTERSDLVSLNNRKIPFFRCSNKYTDSNRKRRDSMEQMNFEFDPEILEAEGYISNQISD